MKEEPILTVKNLRKQYEHHSGMLPVLEDISFDVSRGKVTCFVGPSGCGKSTILKAVGDLITHQGRISINGKTPAAASRQKNIGYAFQDAVLIEWKTVGENILLPSEIGDKWQPPEIARHKAKALLQMVGLSDFERFYPGQLSGGMRQRVAFARALLLDPHLLLLDEPFSSLDAISRLKLTLDLKAILDRTGTTTVLVTHDLTEAAYLADDIYILSARPAVISYHVEVKYEHERNLRLLDEPEFNNLVSFCRQKLFENAF